VSAETAIIEAFRQLVITSPFDKITIQEICAEAKVSRKTFYAHYDDKHNILEQVIRLDIIKPLVDLRTMLPTGIIKSAPQLLTETIYRNILKNRSFYQQLLSSKRNGRGEEYTRSLFIRIVTSEISQINLAILHDTDWTAQEKDYMAYFFASAQAMLIIKWVRDGMTLPPEQLAKIFNRCTHGGYRQIFKAEMTW
jgi:AcrR family transcriptional regulator